MALNNDSAATTWADCPACHEYCPQHGPTWGPLFKGEVELYQQFTCTRCKSTRIPEGVGCHVIYRTRFARTARRLRRAS